MLVSVSRTGRERLADMDRIEIGQRADSVTELLGVEPRTCPAAPLDHLNESFPEGWAPAAIDVALEQLSARTAQRWVYPIGDRAAECSGIAPRTEVGVGPDGNVVWSIAVLGRSVLELPPTVTPAGVDSIADAQRSS